MSGNPVSNRVLVFLFFLSGFCNLVFETVWVRMFNLVFGVTVFAVSSVLASFMLGLAIGGFFSGRAAEKTKNSLFLFSLAHGGIFLSSIVMLLVFPLFQDLYLYIYKSFGLDITVFRIVLFLLSLLLLIVPAALMGTTFPVACKAYAGLEKRPGRGIGLLYSVNTLGSVAGCVVTIFFLLGTLGMRGTLIAAAVIDLLIGVSALFLKRSALNGEGQAAE
jgi:spermidine synthase